MQLWLCVVQSACSPVTGHCRSHQVDCVAHTPCWPAVSLQVMLAGSYSTSHCSMWGPLTPLCLHEVRDIFRLLTVHASCLRYHEAHAASTIWHGQGRCVAKRT